MTVEHFQSLLAQLSEEYRRVHAELEASRCRESIMDDLQASARSGRRSMCHDLSGNVNAYYSSGEVSPITRAVRSHLDVETKERNSVFSFICEQKFLQQQGREREDETSAVSAGAVPAGAVPAGDVPAGDVPAGDVPAGDVPAGAPAVEHHRDIIKLSSATSSSTRFLPVPILRRRASSAALKSSIIGIINPEQSRALQRWDVTTCIALSFVAVAVPVHVSMLETEFGPFFMVTMLVDLVFLADLFLQFFIMYPKRTNFGYVLEHSHKAIVKNYLKTWFGLDFISVIPIDLVTFLTDSQDLKRMRAVKFIRLLRLLKLARLARAARLLQRYEARASIPYGKLALMKFFLILFLITHWLACTWALTLRLVEETDGLPRWVDSITEIEVEHNVHDKTKDTTYKLYITCLYFTSYTITSIGYGDIGPVNIIERITATFMIIVAGISWAVVLGQVCGIVSNLDTDEQTFRSRMDELNKMMEDRVIAPELRRKLRSFFLSNKTAQRRARHRSVILAMSPGLRGEVALETNRRWITNVSFLESIAVQATTKNPHNDSFTGFLVELSMRLNTSVFAQSEKFGIPHELYILMRGLVGQDARIRHTGSVWGADFVISDRHLLAPWESFALTYVELMTLRRSCFVDVLEVHGTACPELKKRVRYITCWMATQRAILKESARRKERMRRKARDASPRLSISISSRTRDARVVASPNRCTSEPSYDSVDCGVPSEAPVARTDHAAIYRSNA